jgi:hypothetical protein
MLGVNIYCGLAETPNENKYILVFTDYLSRWAEASPMKRRDAKTVEKLYL